MSKEMMAVIGFGAIGLVAIMMLAMERRGIAKRKEARGGREVDLSSIFTTPNGSSGKGD